MSEQPVKRVKNDDEPLMIPLERFLLFNQTYNGLFSLSQEDDLFKKSSEEIEWENNAYIGYLKELKQVEEMREKTRKHAEETRKHAEETLKHAEEMRKLAEETQKREIAEMKFIRLLGIDSSFCDKITLGLLCDKLGQLLYDFVDGNLTDDQKVEFKNVVENFFRNDHNKSNILLTRLGLIENSPISSEQIEPDPVLIPKNTDGTFRAPYKMTRQAQRSLQSVNQNYVFPYPFDIEAHFPVLFCHPVFAEFLKIVNGDIDDPKFINYIEKSATRKDMDLCLAKLIVAILDGHQSKNEEEFVVKVVEALKILFPDAAAHVKTAMATESSQKAIKSQMDGVITIQSFPFIIIEAKHDSYSMNAVLQGFQYYGINLMDSEFIDNDPCFLMTVDKGFLYIYGLAKVNRRVVCSCLLSMEFTNYHFNLNEFREKLYRCFGALSYFYMKFTDRLPWKADDEMHKKYSAIKAAHIAGDKPYPAIFKVKDVGIRFKSVEIRTPTGGVKAVRPYLAPCVYLVETLNDKKEAVLKITNNYAIDVHKKLQESYPSLVPRIIEHEVLFNQYHVILMEYFDQSSYDNLANYLNAARGNKKILNRTSLSTSISAILPKLKELKIVHGDFRSVNILAKRSAADPAILEDFKLIDFEYSGLVDTPYPFVALKNDKVHWHQGFNSFAPRKFEHDEYMLENMKSEF